MFISCLHQRTHHLQLFLFVFMFAIFYTISLFTLNDMKTSVNIPFKKKSTRSLRHLLQSNDDSAYSNGTHIFLLSVDSLPNTNDIPELASQSYNTTNGITKLDSSLSDSHNSKNELDHKALKARSLQNISKPVVTSMPQMPDGTVKSVITEEPPGEYPKDLFTMKQKQYGAVIFHVMGMMYMFVALAVVCDEFFVPALGVITIKFQISDDVAGATFMAAGGSAPELFTSILGVFVAYSNVGIGTIVGSAVFNILFIIGVCAILSKEVLLLTWWPLFRDVSFYVISLAILIAFFYDEFIFWYEALVLFLTYVTYVLFMKFNEKIEAWVKRILFRGNAGKVGPSEQLDQDEKGRAMLHGSNKIRHGILQLMIHSIDPLHEGKLQDKVIELQTITSSANGIENGHPTTKEENQSQKEAEDEDEEKPVNISWPDTWKKRIIYIIVIPLVFPLWLTLPDVKRPEKKKWFFITFFGSIVWIAIFSYLMVWWANEVGTTVKIPSEVMGLTFLAAGTSIPDLITSVIVARKGLGDMAVSSSVGSNIFDVTVGLPVPWLLYAAVHLGAPISVKSNGMFCSIVMLFIMLLLVIGSIALFKWKMSRALGGVMFVLYVIFVIGSLLLEYKVIKCPI